MRLLSLFKIVSSFLIVSFLFHPSTSHAKKPNKGILIGEAGLNFPSMGVAIDGAYDPRLDQLVPGYKILNVVITNKGGNTIKLDLRKEVWKVRDNLGKFRVAINDGRFISEKLWNSLSEGLRNKLENPDTIKPGQTAKVDLFFPVSVNLKDFKELQWQSTHFKKKFIIEEGVEKNLDLAKDSEPDPLHNKKTYQQSLEKYETPDEKNAAASEPGSQQPSGPKGDGNIIEISPSANDAMSDRNSTPPRFDPKLDEVVTIPLDN